MSEVLRMQQLEDEDEDDESKGMKSLSDSITLHSTPPNNLSTKTLIRGQLMESLSVLIFLIHQINDRTFKASFRISQDRVTY